MGLMDKLCWWLVKKYPHRSRVIEREGEPYLLRFYITKPHTKRVANPEPEQFGLYLHHFFQGDKDPDLHNHPWRWALSLILSGSYVEERLDGYRVHRTGGFNLITHDVFHRVTLGGPSKAPVWTLFTVGPRISSWGFKNRATGVYLDWKTYLRERGENIS